MALVVYKLFKKPGRLPRNFNIQSHDAPPLSRLMEFNRSPFEKVIS